MSATLKDPIPAAPAASPPVAAAPSAAAPGLASAPPDAAAPAVTRKRPPIALIVIVAAALVFAGFGARQYVFGLSHVSTDNAQIEGHVIPILPKIGGYVTQVLAEENQQVKAGELLVQIDDRDQRAKLAQADADLAAALAAAGDHGRPGQAESQLAAARATVTQAEANATRARADVERYRALAPRGIVSRQQLDAAVAASSAADAALLAMRNQVASASSGVTGATARVAAARAARDQAALNLSYTRALAPASGVVSRKNVEVGQYVQAGQPTMSVVPLDDVWVTANLKETEIEHVSKGDRAVIDVDSYHGKHFTGVVESVSPATGAKFSLLPPDNSTGNFTKVVQLIPVRLRFPGAADPRFPLRPGMSAKVVITTK